MTLSFAYMMTSSREQAIDRLGQSSLLSIIILQLGTWYDTNSVILIGRPEKSQLVRLGLLDNSLGTMSNSATRSLAIYSFCKPYSPRGGI